MESLRVPVATTGVVRSGSLVSTSSRTLSAMRAAPTHLAEAGSQRMRGSTQALGREPHHLLEWTFASDGDPWCSALPGPRRSERVLGLAAACEHAAVVAALVRGIPCACYALRLRRSGKLSVFFRMDFDPTGLRDIVGPLGTGSLARRAAELTEALGTPSCGLAVETDARCRARVRVYWMAAARGGVSAARATVACASRRLRTRACRGATTDAAVGGLPQPSNVILNVSVHAGECGLKLELPQMPMRRVARLSAEVPGPLRPSRWRATRSLTRYSCRTSGCGGSAAGRTRAVTTGPRRSDGGRYRLRPRGRGRTGSSRRRSR